MSSLVHPESGEIVQEQLPIPLAQQTAQAIGGAITYGRRYLAMAMCGLAPDDDDDGNTASQQRQPPAQQKPQAQPVARYPSPPVAKEPTPIAADSDEALRQELERVGTAHYGAKWPATKAHNVEKATGQTDSSKLTTEQVQKLITGIKQLQAQKEKAA
jgi:hypothetical protein